MPGWGDDNEVSSTPKRALINANALERYVGTLVRDGLSGRPFQSPATLLEMNRLAVDGLEESAGVFRDGPCTIFNSMHVPPAHENVPALVEAMGEEIGLRFQA
jgi:Fic family protein